LVSGKEKTLRKVLNFRKGRVGEKNVCHSEPKCEESSSDDLALRI
jgi:hypothetical protein